MTATTEEPSKLASVIEKIRKLQALAGNNTNENEIKAACAAAEKLIAEYRLTQAQLEVETGSSDNDPTVNISMATGKKRSGWRECLIGILVKHYGCAYYVSSHRFYDNATGKESGSCAYKIFGRKSDIECVSYMYRYLEREIESVATEVSRGKGLSYAHAWRMGCATGIREQFVRMKAESERAAQSSAMVLLQNRAKESNLAMRSSGIRLSKTAAIGGVRDSSGFYDGKAHGSSMSIRNGLGGGNETTGHKLKK